MNLLTLFSRSDATLVRSAESIARTQFGHEGLAFMAAILAGYWLGPWWAVAASLALWAGLWEGAQFLRQDGEPKRVRRLWDWVSDGAAYAAGAVLFPLMLVGPEAFVAGLLINAAVVGILAEIWGQEQPPT